MKEIRSLINGLVVCGIALAMASTVAAQGVMQCTAKVVRVKGSARYSLGNDVWENLKVGATLRAGSVIQTEDQKGAFVDLVLCESEMGTSGGPSQTSRGGMSYQPSASQNIVRLAAGSTLSIDKLTSMQTGSDVVTETQLELKKGKVLGSVKKLSAASKYEVKLPNGVAGVRGTTYMLSTDGIVDVLDGSVVVAYQTPNGVVTQVVSAGQSFNMNTGQLGTISSADMTSLNAMVGAGTVPSNVSVFTGETIIAIDQTTYFISPTNGF